MPQQIAATPDNGSGDVAYSTFTIMQKSLQVIIRGFCCELITMVEHASMVNRWYREIKLQAENRYIYRDTSWCKFRAIQTSVDGTCSRNQLCLLDTQPRLATILSRVPIDECTANLGSKGAQVNLCSTSRKPRKDCDQMSPFFSKAESICGGTTATAADHSVLSIKPTEESKPRTHVGNRELEPKANRPR